MELFSILSVVAVSLFTSLALAQNPNLPSGYCSMLEILIARGTNEPGEYGVVVGDPLVRGVVSHLHGAFAYAVQYPANISAESAPMGRDDVIKRLNTQVKACPNQRYALVGYSQGAAVMHMAAANLSLDIYPKVIALVMFGDPGEKQGNTRVQRFPVYLGSRLKEICAPGDPVCSDGNNRQAHTSYNKNGTTFLQDGISYIFAAWHNKTGATMPSPADPGRTTPPIPPTTSTVPPLNSTSPVPTNSTGPPPPPQLPNPAPPKSPGNPKLPGNPKGPAHGPVVPSPRVSPTPRASNLPSTSKLPERTLTLVPASPTGTTTSRASNLPSSPGAGRGTPKSPSDPDILNPPQSIPQTAPIEPPVYRRRVQSDGDVLWKRGLGRRFAMGRRGEGRGVLREGWL